MTDATIHIKTHAELYAALGENYLPKSYLFGPGGQITLRGAADALEGILMRIQTLSLALINIGYDEACLPDNEIVLSLGKMIRAEADAVKIILGAYCQANHEQLAPETPEAAPGSE